MEDAKFGVVGEDGQLRAPPKVRKLIDAVNDFDRERFDAEPELTEFVRSALDGEFWPQSDDEVFGDAGVRLVRVVRGGRGWRVRLPFGVKADAS